MDAPGEPGGTPPKIDSPPPAAQPAPANRKRWGIHLALIGGYPLVIGILGWGRVEQAEPALSSGAAGLLIASTVELVVFAIVFGLAWLASHASRADLLWKWRGGLWTVPLGLGYSVAIRLALGIVVGIISSALVITRLMTPTELEQFLAANRPDIGAVVDVSSLQESPLYYWLTLTLVSFIVGGLREELWRSGFLAGMRRLWPGRFGSRGGQILAAAVAAVIFGLGHLAQGMLAAGLTGLLGFGLGMIMVVHRSIWPAVIAHGAFNATSLAMVPWAMDQLERLQPGALL